MKGQEFTGLFPRSNQSDTLPLRHRKDNAEAERGLGWYGSDDPAT